MKPHERKFVRLSRCLRDLAADGLCFISILIGRGAIRLYLRV
jgi:hypothetical protein